MRQNSFFATLLGATLLLSSSGFGETITGGMYDLKRSSAGDASSLKCSTSSRKLDSDGCAEVVRLISEFFAKGWDRELFDGYYTSGNNAMVSHFFLPSADAEALTKGMSRLKSSGLCFIYKGSVKAPFSGKIRFVGAGDDLLAFRFNNELVLEAGNMLPSLYTKKMKKQKDLWSVLGTLGFNKKYQKGMKRYRKSEDYQLIPHDEYPHWTGTLGGLVAGPIIEVKEGEEYPIELLYAEIDGKGAGYVLLYQIQSEVQKGEPNSGLKLFRTNFVLPSERILEAATKKSGTPDPLPTFDTDTPIWKP